MVKNSSPISNRKNLRDRVPYYLSILAKKNFVKLAKVSGTKRAQFHDGISINFVLVI